MSRKNVLFVASDPYEERLGGVDRVTRTLRALLEEKGYSTFYYNPRESDDYKTQVVKYNDFIKDNNIDVVINQEGLLASSKVFLSVENKNIKIISVLHNDPRAGIMRLWSFCSEKRHDVNFELARRCIRIGAFPYLYIKHLWQLRKHFEFIGRYSDKVVVLSETFKKSVSSLSTVAAKKTVDIPNPNTYQIKSDYVLPLKERIVLYVGRFDNRSKRVDLLLRIWKYASRLLPEWRLVLVGFGPDEYFLKKLSDSLHLKRIEFVGKQDPRKYYEKASVLCLTSRYEGFGMVLTEAQQFGVVPIAFNSYSAITDIIDHEETGILVKPFQMKSFIKALVDLCSDDERRRLLSENAKARVCKFDADNIVNSWINLIESI